MKVEENILDMFVNDFVKFLQKYYAESFVEITAEQGEFGLVAKIIGLESVLEIINDGDEITISFGESHWHISDYNTPVDFTNICKNTIDTVFSVLKGELITYSCWDENSCLGGGSFYKATEESIRSDAIKSAGDGYFKKARTLKIKYWNSAREEFPVEFAKGH